MKKSLLLIAAVGIITGCTSVPKKEEAKTPAPVVAEAKSEYPQWFVNPPTEDGKIITVGTAESPNLQLAIDLAIVSAKTTLADVLGGKITSKTSVYIGSTGVNNVASETEKVTNNVINDVNISGWRPRDSVINKDGNKYRAFVMIEYVKSADQNKAKKAFESLEGKAPVVSADQVSAVKPLDVSNKEYVARREEVLKRPDAVIIQKIVR